MIKLALLCALVTTLGAPNHYKPKRMTSTQVRHRATQITRYLKNTHPSVLKEVLRQMGWQPRQKRRPQNKMSEFDRWYIDMMLDLGGIRKKDK